MWSAADFWSLDYGQCLEGVHDSDIERLEKLAQEIAPRDCQCQFDGDLICFRFRTEFQRAKFIIAYAFQPK
jgi:hypothetical protein